jgi:APA family basic amino acid/polyamine antiporter
MDDMTHRPEAPQLKRVLGVFACTMLVVGNMIGVGIFTTPGRIAAMLPSSGLVLTAWILGALLALAGALSYAELGAMYPEAGGNYVFLRQAYGPFCGFLYGWTAALMTQSGTVAILAVGFTKYAGINDPRTIQLTAAGMILVFGALNYVGVQVGSGIVSAITALKIFAILGFAAAAILFGHGSFAHAAPAWPAAGTVWSVTAFLSALIPIMYTYSGWNATVYVGGEVSRPERTIPLSLLAGVLLTAVLYLLLNVIYIYAVPVTTMAGEIAAAKVAAGSLFEPRAAQAVTLFIAFSVLGCLNATLLTAPRIPFAMARDGQFLPMFGRIHPRFKTPGMAIALVTGWAVVLALWGGIDQKHFYRLLDDYVTVPSLLLNALTVSALFVLRRRAANVPRPYRAWGYPVLPLAFIAMVLFMVGHEFHQDPRGSIAGLVMVAVSLPFYFIFRRKKESLG